MKNFKRSIAAVAVVSALGVSAPVLSAEAEDEAKAIEKISVTGSRIKRADMEGANPVQIISRTELVSSGITNMGDMLQEIPAVAGAGTNTAVNNGGSGAIRVSLRGLGSDRTLVLVNGRRMVASGSGANASVDLSTIPTAIVERVEVLKDGASAIYGSDAIGGVVNIITRNDFEGFEVNASYDAATGNGDGETKTIDFTLGFSGDRGNAVFNAFYVQQGAQWSGDRDWSEFEYFLEADGTFSKGGSSAPPWSRLNGINSANEDNFVQQIDEDGNLLFTDADGDNTIVDTGEPVLGLPPGTCDSFTHGAGSGPGQSDPTDFANETGYDCWDWDTDTYNYAPANYHLTPSERLGFFAAGEYEISESILFTSELNFSRRTSETKLAPLPLAPLAFFGVTDAAYSADNYYNQTQGPKDLNGDTVEIADWRRRVVETGGRDTKFKVDTLRAMLALSGDIGDSDWGYEVSYVYGSNEASTNRAGGVNFEKVSDAVGPSFLDSETGEVVCGTPENPIAGCVSLNVFGLPGSSTEVSQEMLDYISFEAHDLGGNEQQIISASIFGDAFELPAGTVGIAVGLENRVEKGYDYPDALIALGVTSGSSRTATEGDYEVNEAYVEANFPILESTFLAENLDIDVAVRYSDYNTFGDTSNYKFGIRWVPMSGLLVRGTSSSAFRAPSTSDLFAGSSDNSPTVVDPCNENPTSFCIADGVPSAGFEPIGDQLSSTRGGNDELTPEEADILTVGVVYSPEFVEGLSFTVDYWSIEITNAISTLGEQLILDSCAASGEHCEKITRFGADSPLYGNSIDIDDRNVNVGGVDSSGLDFNVRYSMDLESLGTLRFNLDSTKYGTYDITQANGDVLENGHKYLSDDEGGHGNFPEWKTNFDVKLTTDAWSAGWSMRYIGEVQETYTEIEGQDERTVDSQIIHDARFSYFMDKMTVSVGLDNILDQDPPFLQNGFNDNTDPRTYNTTGRHAYVSLAMKF